MPMIYRTSEWKRMRDEEFANASRKGVRPISTVGGGRGGSLMAITEVARAADGR
jgi:hypothetical protein